MKPGLYVIGTPIGNLGDITKRAEETLSAVDFILAEDPRHSGTMIKRLDIFKPMLSCHNFNDASRAEYVVNKIKAGSRFALISSAGMPGISDPGSRIVSACRAENLYVTVVPGASAVISALSISGLDTQKFMFEGFLPVKPGKKKKRLQELADLPYPIVIYESPYR
ncbi:MAG: 16S rRNA (cytidine(1402)-2'-O)-methyltransferase, partial [Lentisphaerae bacterium]|nr:16S rRNA (cytidine(1402)-2'-O)-methyltransferase [Lentisphaerota bacterium]